MKTKKTVIAFGDMRLGKDSNRSKRTPTVRKDKNAIVPVDRFPISVGGRPRIETGASAVADLGVPIIARPSLAEREALDRIMEPLLAPIRRVVPLAGMIDFSPMILMILIEIISRVLIYIVLSL